MQILIHGAGKLGQAIIAAAQTEAEKDLADGAQAVIVAGAVDGYLVKTKGQDALSVPLFAALDDVDVDFDVVIDSSRAEYVDAVLQYAVDNQKPAVIAATGHTDEQLGQIEKAAKSVAVLRSSNLSVGVNVVRRLAADAARMLGTVDTEIVEAHHRMKIDAPSGTALTLAEAVRDASDPQRDFVYGRTPQMHGARGNEIGIHAVRGGTVIGEHTVTFLLEDEIVEVRHVAQSRQVFGYGALEVAKFIVEQPAGLYSMEDLLG